MSVGSRGFQGPQKRKAMPRPTKARASKTRMARGGRGEVNGVRAGRVRESLRRTHRNPGHRGSAPTVVRAAFRILVARLEMGSGGKLALDFRSGWGGRSTKLRVGGEGALEVEGRGLSLLTAGAGFTDCTTKGGSAQGESSGLLGELVPVPAVGNKPGWVSWGEVASMSSGWLDVWSREGAGFRSGVPSDFALAGPGSNPPGQRRPP